MTRTKDIIAYLRPLLYREDSELELFITRSPLICLLSYIVMLFGRSSISLPLLSLLSSLPSHPPPSPPTLLPFSLPPPSPSPSLPLSLPSSLPPSLLPSLPPSLPPSLRSECEYYFSLSWLITWYGHVARTPEESFRLMDVFLASHPLQPAYVAAAVSNYCTVSHFCCWVLSVGKIITHWNMEIFLACHFPVISYFGMSPYTMYKGLFLELPSDSNYHIYILLSVHS